jgi:hypothetical protein
MHQLRMSPLRPFSGWTKIPSSLPDFFFFFPPLPYPKIFPRPTYHLPPPVLPTTYLPHPTYHLPPPSYLPPTTPTPPSLHRQSSKDLGRLWSGSWSCGCGAGAAGAGAELLELERDPHAHEKVRSLACLLAATQQAPEPGSGACVALLCCGLLAAATQQAPERESLLLQHSKLRSLLQLNSATQQALEHLL